MRTTLRNAERRAAIERADAAQAAATQLAEVEGTIRPGG